MNIIKNIGKNLKRSRGKLKSDTDSASTTGDDSFSTDKTLDDCFGSQPAFDDNDINKDDEITCSKDITMDEHDYCENYNVNKTVAQQPPPILSTPINAHEYKMNHKNRGFCLILNHEQFHRRRNATANLAPREGSRTDATNCREVFTNLGFQVVEQRDLTVAGVRELLKQISRLDHSDMDCFACIVLTHGDHGHLYAADGRYPIDILFNNFLGNNCPSLAGKPKLFFIQACQGSRLDRGVLVESLDAAHYFRIPSYADFLIAYSTLPGFYSWRNPDRGSWFIVALVEVLHKSHMNFDLLTMMTLVSHKVAYEFSSNASTLEQSGMKQVPCITSMLTRQVYFNEPKKFI